EAQQQAVQTQVQHQQAYQEGFAAGVAQGRLVAEQASQQQMRDYMANQAQQAARHFVQLFERAGQQLQQAEQTLAQGTLALACELARQVLRRELTVDTQSVLPVLKEALGLLESQHKAAVVRLHPADLTALGELIQADAGALELSLRADASLQPGDCVVESAGTVVDGTIDKRWQRAVATLGLASSWEPADESA
ncbi:MAG: flagellar assembly protein FliH, partial [Rhodoferax sp.]|nr:flagellar assembly protein FliH [Rhodoferax sp.]